MSHVSCQGKCSEGPPLVLIRAERNTFSLLGDLQELADRVCKDFIPAVKDDKVSVTYRICVSGHCSDHHTSDLIGFIE